ncbi:MAG: ROK family protein [Bacteroidales bacterium]
MNKRIAIGVDIGGHHIVCAAIDINKNEFIPNSIAEEKVNNKASANEIFTHWIKALQNTMSKINISSLVGIGFAMPGPFDYSNGIALFTKEVEKFENLYNINVENEIRKRLSLTDDITIRFINDATAFGIAETWVGKAKNEERTIALTLGTGFGSAFINKGVPVIEGENVSKSGCLWHLPFNEGIADDSFSTRWFVNNYYHRTGKSICGVLDIANEAKNGDKTALQLFQEYGSNMGIFLSPWLEKFDAQSLVIGGNIIGSYDLFGDYLTETLNKNKIKTIVYLSELMETAAIIGSARLIDDMYFEKVKDLLPKM